MCAGVVAMASHGLYVAASSMASPADLSLAFSRTFCKARRSTSQGFAGVTCGHSTARWPRIAPSLPGLSVGTFDVRESSLPLVPMFRARNIVRPVNSRHRPGWLANKPNRHVRQCARASLALDFAPRPLPSSRQKVELAAVDRCPKSLGVAALFQLWPNHGS